LNQLQGQGFIERYARQDDNKDRIGQFNKVLDEALLEFSVSFVGVQLLYLYIKLLSPQMNLQLSVLRRLMEFQLASGERLDEVLDASRTSESERGVRVVDVSRFEFLNINVSHCSSFWQKYLRIPRLRFFFFSWNRIPIW